MKNIFLYASDTDDPEYGVIDELVLRREQEEDLDREKRGMALLSYEVSENFAGKLHDYLEKKDMIGTDMLIAAFREYMERHPAT